MSDLAFGLQITVWGMGLVFGLLALLWALLALAGRLEERLQTRRAPPDQPAVPTAAEEETRLLVTQDAGAPALSLRGPGAGQLPPETTAAIAAAVVAHVANRRKQGAPEMRSYWPGSLLFASRWVAAGRTRQNRGYRRERR